MYLIKCPKCGRDRLWQPYKQKYLTNKRTKCFQCEHTFNPYKNIINNQIIKIVGK